MINIKKLIIPLIILIIIIGSIIVYNLIPTKIAVLTYHDFVEDNPENNMQISKDVFEEEMKYLHDHHYKTLKLEDIECFLEKKCKLDKKSVLITMDDGWKNELEIAAPILKKYNLNAVIFYLGENYDGKNPNFMDMSDLETLKKDYKNIEIANHSYALHYEEAYLLEKNDFINDLETMKEINDSKYYAYPYGKYTDKYIDALKEEDYSLAFTFGPDDNHRKLTVNDNRYEIPRLNLSNGMPKWKFILRLNWYK